MIKTSCFGQFCIFNFGTQSKRKYLIVWQHKFQKCFSFYTYFGSTAEQQTKDFRV